MEPDRNTIRERRQEREHLYEMEAGREFFLGSVYGDGFAEDYWKRFLQTGSVLDYLNYTASNDRESGSRE